MFLIQLSLKQIKFAQFLAHEITHAFDDSGINYNSEGMTAQLYDNKTVEAFHKEATCLRDQYSKYSIAGEINCRFVYFYNFYVQILK